MPEDRVRHAQEELGGVVAKTDLTAVEPGEVGEVGEVVPSGGW